MLSSDRPQRGQGRPRSERARQAVLQATRTLLEEMDFAALTIEAIAAQAGVSKATIYRWWPNKFAVVTDCFLELTAPQIEFSHSGSIRENLHRQMGRLAQLLTGDTGRLIGALIGEGQRDHEAAHAFREHWIMVRRRETRAMLERGVAEGELRPDLDLDVAMDALYGPIYYRLMVGHLPLENSFVDRLAAYLFQGLEHKEALR